MGCNETPKSVLKKKRTVDTIKFLQMYDSFVFESSWIQ